MKEIDSLLDRARVYLSSARMLRETGDFESAVSRGYYAMFYAAEAALLVRDVAANSHKGVIAEFNSLYVRGGSVSMELGRALSRAFEKRQLGEPLAEVPLGALRALSILAARQRLALQLASYHVVPHFVAADGGRASREPKRIERAHEAPLRRTSARGSGDYEYRRVLTAEDAQETERDAIAFVARIEALVAGSEQASGPGSRATLSGDAPCGPWTS